MEPSNMQTVEMFGKQVVYDASKTYGMCDEHGSYGEISINEVLSNFAKNKKNEVLEFIDSQVRELTNQLAKRRESDKKLDEIISPINDFFEEMGGERVVKPYIGPEISEYLQNTIDLFEYTVSTLRD